MMNQDLLLDKLPIIFRYDDAKDLTAHIVNRRSIILIGITRVGIGSFLSFYLNRKDVSGAYLEDSEKHLFIPVNMNDLVECEIAPFWTLVLKRVLDAVENLKIEEKAKKEIRGLFLESIQLQDVFFTIDSVRRSIKLIIEQGYLPTIFFIRFDRLKLSITSELLANLEGLREFTHQQLMYVFTSYLPFEKTFYNASGQASLSMLCKNEYFRPAKKDDSKVLFKLYKKRYDIKLSIMLENKFIEMIGGHLQYMQLGLNALHGINEEIKTEASLKSSLLNDERIRLQSEEIWESLGKVEQNILLKISKEKHVTKQEKEQGIYLWNTGIVKVERQKQNMFSPLFEYFVKERLSEEAKDTGLDFTKKEIMFFDYLKNNTNQICEREKIVEAVWPEASDLGISDWAIDKLAARVRVKIKIQKNNFEIQTIKTRGFRLTEV